MPKYKIIVNPVSGRGNGARSIPTIHQAMARFGLDYVLVQTERQGHAYELARLAAAEGYDYVVAVGGDGTCNEVINGLMRAKQETGVTACLAVLGVGRGNDFAFGAGVPTSLEEGLQVLAQASRRWIDIGFVQGGLFPEGRYFGNGIGIGFDAVVGFVAAKKTHLKGFVNYLVSALETIFIYFHAPTVEISYDGQVITQPSLMISIMNGRRMGGGFLMTPDSLPDDGLFDLCIVKGVGKLKALGIIPLFMKGTQAQNQATRMAQTRQITVRALQGSLPAHADGETVCYDAHELSARILPKQLEILVKEDER